MSYPMVYKPDHPRADVLGYVPQHVLLVEKLLGGPIPKGTIVHHKDWHKTNNPEDGSNYQLMTRLEHQQIPYWQGRFLAEKGLLDEFFEWWKVLKDKPNPYELELKLCKAEQRADRLSRKLGRHGK